MLDNRIANKRDRRKFFMRYYHWSLKTFDCDPAMFMMNYINRRMELNVEQRFWFAWLYANTYNVATAWIIFNEFPDFENVDIDRLEKWNGKNYKKLRYETDNKWQKGHLPKMFESYKSVIAKNHNNQLSYFVSLCNADEYESFDNVYNAVVKNMYKFGRYLAWFYLQTLRETCDLPILPRDLKLKEQSSRSHRNGLLYALGMDDLVETHGKRALSKEQYDMLDIEAGKIIKKVNKEWVSIGADNFTLETTLCAFKKIFRRKQGRYLGYYIDRQTNNISQCQADNWIGIDWDLLWQARIETLDKRLLGTTIRQECMEYFLNTGRMRNIDWFS